MSRTVLMAAAAGGCGVFAAWELIGALQAGVGAASLRRTLRPLRRAGDDGSEPTVAERRRLAAVAAAVLLTAGLLVAGPLGAVALAAAGPVMAKAAIAARRRRWRTALHDAAPAVARSVADALAGGHSVRGAFTEAARRGGVPGPAGVELRAAVRALDLGEPTEVVLERLRRRADAPAYDTLVAAILLQRDAGGDLARLLRELAASLESATRLAKEARTVTAQARFTSHLVAGMPAGAAVLAELASPGYLARLLAHPLTATMLVLAVILQLAGLAAVRHFGRLAA